ncbi:hypothetical protein ACIBG8_03165 [Nonomuraea sp. NPDC050556]|uniref:hypothetical protein n=1 Tax=Nonomuraea sp. NPDC050556 TaxID=3364369 RepID=UPI0037BB3EBF
MAVAAWGLGFTFWTTVSVLSYTRVADLAVGEVATELTVAGLAGLAAGPLVEGGGPMTSQPTSAVFTVAGCLAPLVVRRFAREALSLMA